MSFGTKDSSFRPIDESILEKVKFFFPNLSNSMINDLYHIMTKNCAVETLLFVALLDMIDRFKKGKREDEPDYGHFGAGTKLSAVSHDGKSKKQTYIMELLHDVIVEVQMAGGNFRNLQKYLAQHDMQIVSLHSCYMLVIANSNVDAFYESCGCDQERRTYLDWSGVLKKQVSLLEMIDTTDYTHDEAESAQRIYSISQELVG
jgi:hypothetical protein